MPFILVGTALKWSLTMERKEPLIFKIFLRIAKMRLSGVFSTFPGSANFVSRMELWHGEIMSST